MSDVKPVRLVMAAALLAVGYAVTLALFWGLINVPESTVLALALSALVVLLLVFAAGLTTGGAVAVLDLEGRPMRSAARRAVLAVPAFLLGLAIFALLWWTTEWADGWWARYGGEADALMLRYLHTAKTQPLHEVVSQVLWWLRWPLALSIVAGLVSAGAMKGAAAIGTGLRAALRAIPLVATTFAAIIIGKLLWRVAYWRPASIPASWVEAAFAGVKLGLMYAIAIVIVAVVLMLFQRAISRHAVPARI